jgi:hypothetical protein
MPMRTGVRHLDGNGLVILAAGSFGLKKKA